MITCPSCNGNGLSWQKPSCVWCRNTGKVRIYVEVPPECEVLGDIRCNRQIQRETTDYVLRLREINLEIAVKGIK